MEFKKKLEEMHVEFLEKMEDYLQTKKESMKAEDHQKLHTAKEEWQAAWEKIREVLMTLERIEI